MGFSLFNLTFNYFSLRHKKKEIKFMEVETKVKTKMKNLDYLLRSIDLKSIQLEIDIRNGSRKFEKLF